MHLTQELLAHTTLHIAGDSLEVAGRATSGVTDMHSTSHFS